MIARNSGIKTKNGIVKYVEAAVSEGLRKASRDITYRGKIMSKNIGTNFYTVKINESLYPNIPSAYGYEYSVGEMVDIKANQGNLDYLKIIDPKITDFNGKLDKNLGISEGNKILSTNTIGEIITIPKNTIRIYWNSN